MYKTNRESMAGFYQQGAPEIEQEGLQTLYLMNPAYSGYGDAPSTANFFLLNSAVSHHVAGSPATNNNIQQFLGIPLHPSTSDPNNDISSLQAYTSNLNHSLWNSPAAPPPAFGLRQPQQGLSLSLSPHQRVSIASSSNGVSDFWVGSKYLKVAQQLLDEVVNVGNGVSKQNESKTPARSTKETDFSKNEKSGELTTAERQDLQMKNVKLVNMLEEVEHRYRQYHHHMQAIISSFESAIGNGAAKTYTSLALQTISKQFRCLKDAILSQIRGIAKSLGEEGSLGEERSSSGSRLRFIDHQLRQQRAFQQIGMIQHNAWRPQRGLPERSVSILRAWLFEHFLHPYPKDSDKQMLAKQTGLTRSQVSNWFINARVRLWKPMVEEMYLEELKGEQHNNGEEQSSKRNANGESTSISSANKEIISPTKTDRTNHHPQPPAFSLPHSIHPEYTQSSNPKRSRAHESKNMDFGHINREDSELMMKFGEEAERSHGYSWRNSKINNGDAGLSSFSGEFTPRIMNKSVSLTLGLPHGDSRGHNIPLGRRVELNGNNNEYCGLDNEPSVLLLPSTFEDINVQGRKRFAAAQLLPDFVA